MPDADQRHHEGTGAVETARQWATPVLLALLMILAGLWGNSVGTNMADILNQLSAMRDETRAYRAATEARLRAVEVVNAEQGAVLHLRGLDSPSERAKPAPLP
jgi:hypothetical protein